MRLRKIGWPILPFEIIIFFLWVQVLSACGFLFDSVKVHMLCLVENRGVGGNGVMQAGSRGAWRTGIRVGGVGLSGPIEKFNSAAQ